MAMAMPIASSSWKLQLVARVDAFRTCLVDDDQESVHCATSSAQLRAEFDELSCRELEAIGTSPAQDTHLDRYKKWKLDNAKIEELTSVRMDSAEQLSKASSGHASAAAEAVDAHVTCMNFFARGKRGVLFTGLLRGRAEQVVVKFAGDPRASTSSTAAGCWVETEAKWIRIMNRVGIGARLEGFGTGWLICERLDGKNIVEFLSSTATHLTARWALREILCQCFTMDTMGINKEEMTHPTRHIIIHSVPHATSSSQRRWRCTFIDFEKCSFTKKPKNVTQVCQFISSPRMTALFQAKGVTWDIQSLRLHTKRYKLRVSSETFGALLDVFGV